MYLGDATTNSSGNQSWSDFGMDVLKSGLVTGMQGYLNKTANKSKGGDDYYKAQAVQAMIDAAKAKKADKLLREQQQTAPVQSTFAMPDTGGLLSNKWAIAGGVALLVALGGGAYFMVRGKKGRRR